MPIQTDLKEERLSEFLNMVTLAIERLTKDQLKGILRDLHVKAPEIGKKEDLVEMG